MADDEREHRWPDGGRSGEALLMAMLDAADVVAGVVELLGDDYRIVVANRSASDLYDLPVGGLDGLTGRQQGLTDEQIADRLTTLNAVWVAQETRSGEYSFRFPTGREGWFFGTYSPLRGATPLIAFVILDITARREAQFEVERQGARLSLALDVTGLGLWDYDFMADRVDWDARMRQLFGLKDDGPIDFATYAAAVHPEDFPAVEAAYRSALAGENDGAYVVEHRTAALGESGSAVWIRAAARVMRDAAGRPSHVIGTAQDISAQVAARERQDLLLAELNHRVKNNLATVQAIAGQTMRSAADDPAAFRTAFDGRIQSLARGHDLLTRNVWEAADLRDVIEAALSPFAAELFDIDGPDAPTPLNPEMAVNMVMVLNELATNASKYGALSSAGRVSIAWTVADNQLTLEWRERGGPPVAAPTRSGFGTRLTLAALQAYGGKVELTFPPEGARCRMQTPLEL
ncbi:MAG TPA: HWE histidine kinase domain-containing protein [Phenylobacterium sp.]|nr:HWE histidine kinase domain-containing protein [Phenylobacterium sp.]